MKRSVPLLLALAFVSCDQKQTTPLGTAQAASAPAAEGPVNVEPAPELKQSVVRINSTQQTWSAGQPWEKNPPNHRRALGPIVGKNQVLTTSELVADATYLEFESPDGTRLLPAKIVAVDFEANLALLGPEDDSKAEAFFKGTRPLETTSKTPRIGDTLDILQVEENGMPLMTAGTLQSVDVITNFLEGQFFLTFEVKASMQSAASSFSLPVLHKGKLAGMLASYNSKDQLSDVTATDIVKRFLEASKDGHYEGFPNLGLSTARTEDPSFRKWLKLTDDQGGLYVSKVRKDSAAAAGGIKKGDVIVSVADHKIDRRGYYEHPIYGSLFWSHLVRGEKKTGDTVKVSVVREGKPQDLTITLTRSDDTERLVPAYVFGKAPKYLVKGGFVFQELTKPLLESFGEEWQSRAPLNLLDVYENQEKYENKADHIVFLSGVIATPATIGYEPLRNLIVRKVNGKEIRDMKSLADAFKSPQDGLNSIEFDEENFTVQLDEEASDDVDKQLMQRGIPQLSRVE